MAAHRYWRVRVTVTNGDSFARIGELRMATAAGGANVLVGGAVTFTTQFSGAGDNSAAAAFDGNSATAWAGAMGPAAIGYFLPAALDVQEVTIVCRNDGFGPSGAPRDFTVQFSDDGVAYTNAWTVSGEVGWLAGATRNFQRPTPVKPTISAAPLGRDVTLTGSAFSGDATGHASSQWQVTLATDPTFATPIYNPGFDAAHKLALALLAVLPLGSALIARVRYQANSESVSAYSDATAPFTLTVLVWVETDLDPDVPSTGIATVTTAIGLGPVAGLPRDNAIPTPNPHAVFDGVDVMYDLVVVNPAGFAGIVGESIQHSGGTGLPSPLPLTVTFDTPIRGFKITCVQISFGANHMVAKDASGAVLLDVNFDAVAGGGFAQSITREIMRASNQIKTIELYADPSDWIAWQDIYITVDHASGTVGGWTATDAAPGNTWVGVADPATAWTQN